MAALSYAMHAAQRCKLEDRAHWVYIARRGEWYTKVGVSGDPYTRGGDVVKVYHIGPRAIDVEQDIHSLLTGFEWAGISQETYILDPNEVIAIADFVVKSLRRGKLLTKGYRTVLPSLDGLGDSAA